MEKRPVQILRIEGERFQFDQLIELVDHWRNFIYQVTKESFKKDQVNWEVSFDKGSVCVKTSPIVAASGIDPDEPSRKVNEAIEEIANPDGDPRFSEKAHKHLLDLIDESEKRNGGIQAVKYESGKKLYDLSKLGHKLPAKRRKSVTESGGFEGKIVEANESGKRYSFKLRLAANGELVTCNYDSGLSQVVKRYFADDDRVYCYGEIKAELVDGKYDKRVLSVEGMRRLRKRDELPAADEVMGIFSQPT